MTCGPRSCPPQAPLDVASQLMITMACRVYHTLVYTVCVGSYSRRKTSNEDSNTWSWQKPHHATTSEHANKTAAQSAAAVSVAAVPDWPSLRNKHYFTMGCQRSQHSEGQHHHPVYKTVHADKPSSSGIESGAGNDIPCPVGWPGLLD